MGSKCTTSSNDEVDLSTIDCSNISLKNVSQYNTPIITNDPNYWNNMQDMQFVGNIGQTSSTVKLESEALTKDANYWDNMQDMQRTGAYNNTVVNTLGVVSGMLHATGTKEEMTKVAHDYADAVGMDKANRDLLVVLKTQGNEVFLKKAFEDPRDPNRQMSYSEMRGMYG